MVISTMVLFLVHSYGIGYLTDLKIMLVLQALNPKPTLNNPKPTLAPKATLNPSSLLQVCHPHRFSTARTLRRMVRASINGFRIWRFRGSGFRGSGFRGLGV